jgi:hypothetical protein
VYNQGRIWRFARYCVVQRNKLTCWRYANGNDIKKKVWRFCHIGHFGYTWKSRATKLMNKQTLHILHVYFSQVWELSSIIYSLLFLFYILFIVSTQIAASRRKNLKSDVWTLWLDIAIWSLSQKVKFDFSILPIDVICFMGTFLN